MNDDDRSPRRSLFLDGNDLVRLKELIGADLFQPQFGVREGGSPRPYLLDNGVMRALHFSPEFVQSVMLIGDPYALTVGYTRKMMAFLLFRSIPKHIVLVGLGGGSLTKFCHREFPHSRITTVEIDQEIIECGHFFHIPGQSERMRIIHADAADYFATTNDRVDVVLLDGCDARGVAPAFCNLLFYQNLRARLRPGGMLVMNLVGSHDSIVAHQLFMASAFDDQVIVQDVSGAGNRVAFAFKDSLRPPDWSAIERRAERLQKRHGLDFPAFARKLQRSFEHQARFKKVHVPTDQQASATGCDGSSTPCNN